MIMGFACNLDELGFWEAEVGSKWEAVFPAMCPELKGQPLSQTLVEKRNWKKLTLPAASLGDGYTRGA
jgi:hypothetical protein